MLNIKQLVGTPVKQRSQVGDYFDYVSPATTLRSVLYGKYAGELYYAQFQWDMDGWMFKGYNSYKESMKLNPDCKLGEKGQLTLSLLKDNHIIVDDIRPDTMFKDDEKFFWFHKYENGTMLFKTGGRDLPGGVHVRSCRNMKIWVNNDHWSTISEYIKYDKR